MAAIFTLPISQQLRFINLNESTNQQNYDNRFADRLKYPHTSAYHYTQKILNNDNLWISFRSNYKTINAYLVNESNTRTEITGNIIALYTDSSGRTYYQLIIDITLLSGCYFIEFTGSDIDKSTFIIQSEEFQVVSEFKDSILIEWYGNDSYDDMIYWSDLKQSIRVEGSDRDFQPEQSKSVYDDSDYAPFTLKSKPIRRNNIVINKIPYWILEKINTALSHDEFYVNNVRYNTEDLIESEVKGDSQLYTANMILTQLNFENGEDKEITGGVIEQSYLLINDTDYLLINDSGDRLKIN